MPVASAISASRASGPAARSGWPLRTAASISSASSHIGGAQPARVLGGPLGGGQGLVVAAEAVVEDRAAPVGGGEPEPLAAAQHVLPARLDQRQRLGLLARASSPARSTRAGVRWLPVASTTASASAASDVAAAIRPQKSSTMHAVVERDGQQRERAGAARELDLARGELVPAASSPSARAMWQASQSQRSSSSSDERLVPERAQRVLQRRRPRRVALG